MQYLQSLVKGHLNWSLSIHLNGGVPMNKDWFICVVSYWSCTSSLAKMHIVIGPKNAITPSNFRSIRLLLLWNRTTKKEQFTKAYSAKRHSLRTTVPISVVRQWDLTVLAKSGSHVSILIVKSLFSWDQQKNASQDIVQKWRLLKTIQK